MTKSAIILLLCACACFGKDVAPAESFAQLDAQANSESVPLKSLAAMLAAADPASAFQASSTAGLAKASRGAAAQMSAEPDVSDLKDLAKALNPVVGYFDPLQLGRADLFYYAGFTSGNEETKGFLRHAEIKHGRVAMAAFVGYLAQSNGLYFPWKLTGQISYADIAAAGSPPEQWDALPTSAKQQIILFIGFLEFWSESSVVLEREGKKHYMKGGRPGDFPTFDEFPKHWVPFDLYDPFHLNDGKSREQLDRSLLAEVNNGRLAMLGIMGFLAEQKVPGAVPALRSIAPNLKQYAGEVMAPFTSADDLPFVKDMLENAPKFR